MTNKLTTREKLEITAETALQLIPYVGSALSTAYFSTKQEKRFIRIESFYRELSDQISSLGSQIHSIKDHDEESLISLIERLNDEVEKESSAHKREYFKNFFIHILQCPTLSSNYDERRMLLDSLASITFLEFQVLLSYSDYKERVDDIIEETDSSIKEGASARLEMLGLLTARYSSTTFIGQGPVKKYTSISDFGKKFISFCLE
ncbi:hypothetical protein MKX79_14835 [Viridibacillus sp. FSL R5-0468]|uniref:hypothetical protein n=1 Tax=Viridibacillus sp. FSL R5-0468 TaxID=2921640 RepID=UPI0030FA27DE